MGRRSGFLLAAAVALAACGLDAIGSMTPDDEAPVSDASTSPPDEASSADSSVEDAGLDAPLDVMRPPGLVFAASATALWKMDTSGATEQITKVGDFNASCNPSVEELALDDKGDLYGTSTDNASFYRIVADGGVVACNRLQFTQMPIALAWVAAGVLDAGPELVGYADNGSYERIDPSNGARTTIPGAGLNGFFPGGDVAAAGPIVGYVAARGTSCNWCLVSVDLRSGARTSTNLADFGNNTIFGLAVGSNGKIYGFPNDRSDIYVVTPPTFTVTLINAPNANIRWRGATSRPLP